MKRQKLFVVIARGTDRYVFCFDNESDLPELRRVVGRFAADPALSFTWLDAMKVMQSAQRAVTGTPK